jgi:hypothetical protein
MVLALAVSAPHESWIGFSPEQLAPKIAEVHKKESTYIGRMLAISSHFLGAPYQFSPLGEAEGVDADPLFTTKQFDCLSLVEISMALASTPDMEQALRTLKDIRYFNGAIITGPNYVERKHFMESQWIPENTKLGWLRDVTRQVGGELTVTVQKKMNPEIYKKRKKSLELDLPEKRIPNGTFSWPVIPLDKMDEVAARIPNGSLVFVVRADYQTIPFRITHVGIVVQRKTGTYLRHAKDQGAHMVLDMPLSAVVKRHAEFTKWPVTGFSIYVPQPGSALPDPSRM